MPQSNPKIPHQFTRRRPWFPSLVSCSLCVWSVPSMPEPFPESNVSEAPGSSGLLLRKDVISRAERCQKESLFQTHGQPAFCLLTDRASARPLPQEIVRIAPKLDDFVQTQASKAHSEAPIPKVPDRPERIGNGRTQGSHSQRGTAPRAVRWWRRRCDPGMRGRFAQAARACFSNRMS